MLKHMLKPIFKRDMSFFQVIGLLLGSSIIARNTFSNFLIGIAIVIVFALIQKYVEYKLKIN